MFRAVAAYRCRILLRHVFLLKAKHIHVHTSPVTIVGCSSRFTRLGLFLLRDQQRAEDFISHDLCPAEIRVSFDELRIQEQKSLVILIHAAALPAAAASGAKQG